MVVATSLGLLTFFTIRAMGKSYGAVLVCQAHGRHLAVAGMVHSCEAHGRSRRSWDMWNQLDGYNSVWWLETSLPTQWLGVMQVLPHSHLSEGVANHHSPRPRKLWGRWRRCEWLDSLGFCSGKHALRYHLLGELLEEPQADRQGQHAASDRTVLHHCVYLR